MQPNLPHIITWKIGSLQCFDAPTRILGQATVGTPITVRVVDAVSTAVSTGSHFLSGEQDVIRSASKRSSICPTGPLRFLRTKSSVRSRIVGIRMMQDNVGLGTSSTARTVQLSPNIFINDATTVDATCGRALIYTAGVIAKGMTAIAGVKVLHAILGDVIEGCFRKITVDKGLWVVAPVAQLESQPLRRVTEGNLPQLDHSHFLSHRIDATAQRNYC